MFDRLKHRILHRLDLPRIARRADEAADAVAHHERAIQATQVQIADLATRLEVERARVRVLERWARVEQTTAWVRTAPLRHEPLISVVLPTRNRADSVRTAIASVVAQSYPGWELMVVDDGSTDGTAALLEALAAEDERIRVSRTEGVGAAAARNVGLAAAAGSWIAFLDDDNAMQPDWLRAVAEYSGREPSCQAMFGAQLRDDVLGGDVVPWLLFDDQPALERLRLDNTIDLGALAVAADHPELHFDESLTLYIDWEMEVRIFAATAFHPVPVVASTYTSGASTRITEQHDRATLDAMRRRLAT